MDIDDAALMYQGWGDELLYGQQIARKVTAIICEVVNKSMGGKGVIKQIPKMWVLPGDEGGKAKESKAEDVLKKFKELDLQKGVTAVSANKIKRVTEIKDAPLSKKRKNGKR